MQGHTVVGTECLENEATIDPRMQSVHHGLGMVVESMAAGDDACVDSPLGPSAESVTTPDGDAKITPKSERTTSLDVDNVSCEGDGVVKRFQNCDPREEEASMSETRCSSWHPIH